MYPDDQRSINGEFKVYDDNDDDDDDDDTADDTPTIKYIGN